MEAKLVLDHKCLLGEGPVWDAKTSSLRWLDIIKGHVHTFEPASGDHRTANVNQMIGALAPRRDGGFVAALQKGFALLDADTGAYVMKTTPEAHLSSNRFNDGKCDPEGRFLAGSMALDEKAGAGSLYMLNSSFTATCLIRGTTISNGMAWNRAGDKFYYIDTPTMKVVCYDYDRLTGKLDNGKVVIAIDELDGYPDGMTIDTEDKLWIAHYNGWQVTRRDPETGAVLLRIRLPVAKVTCCTFGGAQMDDLYITTASKEMSVEEHREQPLAGGLFVVKNLPFYGLPPFEFAG